MTDVLVSGADGFVGQHLIKSLEEESDTYVFAMSRTHGDISDAASWATLPKADVVLHLAARTYVPESWKDPAGYYFTNVNGTINALEYCRKHKAKLIFTSSYLYGMPDNLPITEDAELKAVNPYMLSKKAAEEACHFYAKNFDVQTIILRPFNIYGAGHKAKFLIPTIVDQIIESSEVTVNDLEPKRDYLFIDDLVSAIKCAIKADGASGAFNIAMGKSYSVADIIELAQRLSGKNVKVISRAERRPNEIMDTVADISKARSELNWVPNWSLEDGIKAIIESSLGNS